MNQEKRVKNVVTRPSRHNLMLASVAVTLSIVAIVLHVNCGQATRLAERVQLQLKQAQTASLTPTNLTMCTFETKQMDYSASLRGNLILVDQGHPLTELTPDPQQYTALLEPSGSDYFVLDQAICMESTAARALDKCLEAFVAAGGTNRLLVSDGYHTRAQQASLYQKAGGDNQSNQGVRILPPGNEELETGLSCNLSTMRDTAMPDVGALSALSKMMAQYGFVQRFPQDQSAQTQVHGREQVWRYVGAPVAGYLLDHQMTLEGLHTALAAANAKDEALLFAADGKNYALYRVTLDPQKATDVPIPQANSYTLSGDNAGGVVVLVAL